MRAVSALAVALSVLGGSALAQPQSANVHAPLQIGARLPQALKRALKVYGKLRYSGTRIVEFKNGPDRERHTEFVISDGPRSRVEFPPGSPYAGQVIVETPKERRLFNPAANELRVLPPRREEVFGRLAGMANRRVSFKQELGGAVAGFSTQLVSVADPRGNVIQKLWIDPQSGMVLKRELYDRGGALQGFFEYSKVNLNPVLNATEFKLQPKGARLVTPEIILNRLIKRGSYRDVRLTDPTYRLDSSRVQNLAGESVLVQLYVGEGHRISLYQFRRQIDAAKLDQQATGALNTYSWQQGGSTFALIGDLTDTELQSLARRLGA